jgi:hypothetical protein
MKRLSAALLLFSLGILGCNRGEVGVTASPSPSKAAQTFQLEGTVVEASGSAAVGSTPAASPAVASPPATAAAATPTSTLAATVVHAAPGSVALTLTSFSASGGPCSFNDNDVAVVSFVRNTSFKPEDVTESKNFPNNLQGARLRVSGTVSGPRGDDCLLVADAIEVTAAAPSPSPSPRGAARTPTPTGRASPSPTR